MSKPLRQQQLTLDQCYAPRDDKPKATVGAVAVKPVGDAAGERPSAQKEEDAKDDDIVLFPPVDAHRLRAPVEYRAPTCARRRARDEPAPTAASGKQPGKAADAASSSSTAPAAAAAASAEPRRPFPAVKRRGKESTAAAAARASASARGLKLPKSDPRLTAPAGRCSLCGDSAKFTYEHKGVTPASGEGHIKAYHWDDALGPPYMCLVEYPTAAHPDDRKCGHRTFTPFQMAVHHATEHTRKRIAKIPVTFGVDMDALERLDKLLDQCFKQ